MVFEPPPPRIILHHCLCFTLPFSLALKDIHILKSPLDLRDGPAVSLAMHVNDDVSLSPAFLTRYPRYHALKAINLSAMKALFASKDLFKH